MGAVAKISRKWQVVIPKEVRDQLALKPGDRVCFNLTRSGAILKKKEVSAFDRYFGFLAKKGSTDRIIKEMRGDR